jgi:kinetochore protein Nuf2
MNCTRETVEPAMREASRDICGEELADIVPGETRNMMGFYASLRKLLEAVRLLPRFFSNRVMGSL